MNVSPHFADSAATTCKYLIRDSQDAISVNPQPAAGGILDRYRRSLQAMTEIFQRPFKDPTWEDFRDCDTPLQVLHLIDMLEGAIREFTSEGLNPLRTSLGEIRKDATWLIASGQSHSFIVQRRRLLLIPGSRAVRWSDVRVRTEGACDEFDRLMPGLSPPTDWKDRTRCKRDQYGDSETAGLTIEIILDHLLGELLPYCNAQLTRSNRRAEELARLPERYPFSSSAAGSSSPATAFKPAPKTE